MVLHHSTLLFFLFFFSPQNEISHIHQPHRHGSSTNRVKTATVCQRKMWLKSKQGGFHQPGSLDYFLINITTSSICAGDWQNVWGVNSSAWLTTATSGLHESYRTLFKMPPGYFSSGDIDHPAGRKRCKRNMTFHNCSHVQDRLD